MNISTETVGRLLASGRGYAQYVAGVATTIGLLSAANSKAITDSIGEIVTGLNQVMHGATSLWQVGVIVLGPAVSVVLAKWSSSTAKTENQAAAVKAAVIDPNTPISSKTAEAIVVAANEVAKS